GRRRGARPRRARPRHTNRQALRCGRAPAHRPARPGAFEKKTAMSPADTGRDGHALAARYEQLRQSVANARTGHRGGVGQRMAKGRAAWMSSAENEPPRRTDAARSASEPGVPEGIERRLIDILATMTLANVLEVRT